MVSKYP